MYIKHEYIAAMLIIRKSDSASDIKISSFLKPHREYSKVDSFMTSCFSTASLAQALMVNFHLLFPGNKEMTYLHRASWLAELTLRMIAD